MWLLVFTPEFPNGMTKKIIVTTCHLDGGRYYVSTEDGNGANTNSQTAEGKNKKQAFLELEKKTGGYVVNSSWKPDMVSFHGDDIVVKEAYRP